MIIPTYFADASSNVTTMIITLSSRFSRNISKFVLSKYKKPKKKYGILIL